MSKKAATNTANNCQTPTQLQFKAPWVEVRHKSHLETTTLPPQTTTGENSLHTYIG